MKYQKFKSLLLQFPPDFKDPDVILRRIDIVKERHSKEKTETEVMKKDCLIALPFWFLALFGIFQTDYVHLTDWLSVLTCGFLGGSAISLFWMLVFWVFPKNLNRIDYAVFTQISEGETDWPHPRIHRYYQQTLLAVVLLTTLPCFVLLCFRALRTLERMNRFPNEAEIRKLFAGIARWDSQAQIANGYMDQVDLGIVDEENLSQLIVNLRDQEARFVKAIESIVVLFYHKNVDSCEIASKIGEIQDPHLQLRISREIEKFQAMPPSSKLDPKQLN